MTASLRQCHFRGGRPVKPCCQRRRRGPGPLRGIPRWRRRCGRTIAARIDGRQCQIDAIFGRHLVGLRMRGKPFRNRLGIIDRPQTNMGRPVELNLVHQRGADLRQTPVSVDLTTVQEIADRGRRKRRRGSAGRRSRRRRSGFRIRFRYQQKQER